MTRLCIIFCVLLVVSACIDRVELPIRAEEPRLVVEGQITNEAPPYTVRLSYTVQYDAEGKKVSPLIGNAQVSLGDDQGRMTLLTSTGNGAYQTTHSTFRGQVGRAYSLTVVLSNGKRYVSKPERMPAVPGIDSISTWLVQINNFRVPYRYAYTITTRDPGAEKNYYRWTAYGYTIRKSTGVACCTGCSSICFDNCYTTELSTDINVFSDDAINGNAIRNRAVFQLPIYANWPQLVEVQQYGITLDNYQFWKLYQQQGARTGSIFDPLPAPVVGNMVNVSDPTDRARGYFAVTSVTRRRIINQAQEARSNSAVYGFIVSQPVPLGDCRSTYGPVPVTLPEGWP